MVPKFELPNIVTFKAALEGGKRFTIKEFVNEPDDVIIHQYTGGTTGVSKGAMLTNRNMVANLNQMRAFMKVCLNEKGEVNLNPLPMYHIFAFTVTGLALTTFGVKSVLVTNPRDIKSLLSEFNKNKITVMSGLNTLYNAMINHPDFEKVDMSSLKMAVAGGMAMQVAVSERWEKATGVRIAEGFGMTETSPVVTVNPLDGNCRLGTIGIPVPPMSEL
jgi:long-chain acyl-CoA synthetase